MRKLAILSFLILVPIIVGISLRSVGYNTGNNTLEYAGEIVSFLGTFVTAVALVAAGLVMMILGKFKFDFKFGSGRDESGTPISKISFDSKSDKIAEESEAEKEAERLQDINSSEGYESQLKQAEYVAGHSANAYQNSSTGKKVLIWTYFSILLLAFTCIPFFIFFKVYLGAYISGGVFVGTILISVIIKLAVERAGRRAYRRHPDKVVKAQGVVKACILSSMSSTGGGNYRSSVRITGITYRVIIVVDGREYEGYTSRCFNEGEIITVMIDAKGKSKRAHIV